MENQNTPAVHIRKAGRDDLPSVHGLVRQLAVYERAEEEFIASLDEYLADFEANIFDALVAEMDGRIVGMALYYMTYSTWKGKMLYLEDFIVEEPYRRFGVGRRLFDAFLQEAQHIGCRLVKWQVLDWNQPALRFYEKYNATIEQEWWNGKIFFSNKANN